jgi:hypothetical protein
MKNLFQHIILLIIGKTVLVSCIDPINIKVPFSTPKLVVEGYINNIKQKQRVKLSFSNNFSENKIEFIPVVGAKVKIVDNINRTFPLYELTQGIYESDSIAGTVGHSYQLFIETQDGKRYQSSPETLEGSPIIDSIYAEYEEFDEFFKNSFGEILSRRGNGFKVFIKSKDAPNKRNFYRWRSEGVFQFYTVCAKGDACDPAPPYPILCWAFFSPINPQIAVLSDENLDGNIFTQQIVKIPYEQTTRFVVSVQQHSISQNAFIYWQLIATQRANTGSIFDPPPAQIRGNIFNTDNNEELVLGYFEASGITTTKLTIDRGILAKGIAPYKPIFQEGDCRYVYPNTTIIRPPGFDR